MTSPVRLYPFYLDQIMSGVDTSVLETVNLLLKLSTSWHVLCVCHSDSLSIPGIWELQCDARVGCCVVCCQ
jgi:hypothetical protein